MERNRLWREGIQPEWNLISKFINTGIVLRDSNGIIVGVGVNRLISNNPYCAEMKAAIQALKVATQLKMKVTTFKGDEFNVIMTLNGLEEYDEWKTRKLINQGRKVLAQNCSCILKFSPTDCNRCAHNLIKWTRQSNYRKYVDPILLPPTIWYDKRGTKD